MERIRRGGPIQAQTRLAGLSGWSRQFTTLICAVSGLGISSPVGVIGIAEIIVGVEGGWRLPCHEGPAAFSVRQPRQSGAAKTAFFQDRRAPRRGKGVASCLLVWRADLRSGRHLGDTARTAT